jgi:hypothetical protein
MWQDEAKNYAREAQCGRMKQKLREGSAMWRGKAENYTGEV